MTTAPLILYDGDCNMCNATVQWVLRRDHKAVFRFAALSSQAANLALQQAGVTRESLPDSMVVIDSGGVHTQSEAAIRIANKLGGVWSVLTVARICPRSWRDAIYALVARHRKRIMSSRTRCLVPTSEVQARFLDRNERPSMPRCLDAAHCLVPSSVHLASEITTSTAVPNAGITAPFAIHRGSSNLDCG